MSYFNLFATCAFGLESVVADELRRLDIKDITSENGRINFTGDFISIIRTNLWLRCADRVYIKLAEFMASDWDELFDGTKLVKWEDIIPENGVMHVVGRSVKSKLHSVPDCQAMVKKAIIESMKRKYRRDIFSEDGPLYRIEISIHNDKAVLALDTSGEALNKRGYRIFQGEAPLKETLAAAIIYLSKWKPDRMLADPFCGSGTIPIEAALIAKNMAPGLNRTFASETWTSIPARMWKTEREDASASVKDLKLEIFASDISREAVKSAVSNAERAGVADRIVFQKKPLDEFSTKNKFGCMICNPPYGERMNKKTEVDKLYREMGEVFAKLDSWSYFILTAREDFENYFGLQSNKNRKLYNGKIKTYLFQYYGKFPPRRV